MFDNLFGKKKPRNQKKEFPDAPEFMRPKERMRAIEGSTSAELAATLLIAPTALMQLSREEALKIVSYMIPRRIDEGTTFIKEGDKSDTGYMMLLLEGEVTVENIVVSRRTPITVNVLGPGSLIGEMGLVDGHPRLASCTASSEVRCAILSRAALEKMGQEDPVTAAKLMFAVSQRIAERLRDTTDKLKMYSQLVVAMQQEIDRLMPT
ncbi:MAG: cyclic nucleotide-binding domain-containing protein [Comamonadaceae bacterium]|nr:MAG: cyclic nucleotide-binding domain-containing protein [Comamonadaceae bacterium]